MKRLICGVLLIGILLSFNGCQLPEKTSEDTVTFYYLREEYLREEISQGEITDYGENDSVIGDEKRDVQGYTGNLEYLLLLYLRGPADAALASPFPDGMKLVEAELEGDTLRIVLGPSWGSLNNLEKALACACLTMTCLDLTDAVQVQIITEEDLASGEKPIVMDQSSFLLLDDGAILSTATESTEE